eukprot:CAMPEP_0201716528 /NCGR_PEP_ID=MMETSP0593-20130828/2468_1 /ASSEMBLY_ACC=CAM_ASM_000672 /TAXON_ID=267983 /ORGANISM="Skeletonema japonicum, Strain CCMP2506" /LENGTH=88 /DNA_ID=CAMNT_0048206339 /DNA_START=92 /DNA_END=358 /DNA_ORIENTATION=-
MAPEFCNAPNTGNGCGLPADVYSFSVLLWENYSLKVYSLKVPLFGTIPKKKIVKGVFSKDKRGNSWPQEIKGLLEKDWSEDPNERPSV